MTRVRSFLLLCALLASVAAAAPKVRVRLRDGDAVVGELLEFSQGTYRVETEAGVRELRADRVASVDFLDNAVPEDGWRASVDLKNDAPLAGGARPSTWAYLDLEGRRAGRLPDLERWKTKEGRAFQEAMGGDLATWADFVIDLANPSLFETPRKVSSDRPAPQGRLAPLAGALPRWAPKVDGLRVGQALRARSRTGREFALTVRKLGDGALVVDVSPIEPAPTLPPLKLGAWRAVLDLDPDPEAPLERRVGFLDLGEREAGRLSAHAGRAFVDDVLVVAYDDRGPYLAHAEALQLGLERTSAHALGALVQGEARILQAFTTQRYRVTPVAVLGHAVAVDVETVGVAAHAELLNARGERTLLHSGVAYYEDGFAHVILSPRPVPPYMLDFACGAPELAGFLDVFKDDDWFRDPRIDARPIADQAQAHLWLTSDALAGAEIDYADVQDRSGIRTLMKRREAWAGAAYGATPGDGPHKPYGEHADWSMCQSGRAQVTRVERAIPGAEALGPADDGSRGVAWVEFDYRFADGSQLQGRVPLYVVRATEGRNTRLEGYGLYALGDPQPLPVEQRGALWPRVAGAQWALRADGGPALWTYDLDAEGTLTLDAPVGEPQPMTLRADEQGDVWLAGGARLNLGKLEVGRDGTWFCELGGGNRAQIEQRTVREPLDVAGRTVPCYADLLLRPFKGDEQARHDGKPIELRYRLAPGVGPVAMDVAAMGIKGFDEMRLARCTLWGDAPVERRRAQHEVPGFTLSDDSGAHLKLKHTPQPTVEVRLEPQRGRRLQVKAWDPSTGAPLTGEFVLRDLEGEEATGQAVFRLEELGRPFTVEVDVEGMDPRVLTFTPN
ncbi:MAG: hypothetical protein R3F62_17175 [Planctomycetota bacterium]